MQKDNNRVAFTSVAVIGGGAAGFFAAIHAKIAHPHAMVSIYEKTTKLLTKVKVSGGGRCNVTNGSNKISELIKAYPRGSTKLKKVFKRFSTTDTQQWFEDRGVRLYTQDDNRVFPTSDSSQTIIDCFMKEARKLGIAIHLKSNLKDVEKDGDAWRLTFEDKEVTADKIIFAIGGLSKIEHFGWAKKLDLPYLSPVPSLFTFNVPNNPIKKLMGLSVAEVMTTVPGTKLQTSGPILVTHWGFSGPAILKLSAFGARALADKSYNFELLINWTAEKRQDIVFEKLSELSKSNPKKQLQNLKPFDLPSRLWDFLLVKNDLSPNKVWGELGKKGINKLVSGLTGDSYLVQGKTTFKEEFVTCGGIDLAGIDLQTMASRQYPDLYFAGELLDIDGITGGYNFQAAWSTGYIAGQLA